MAEGMLRQYCTCDVENYGDLLYPLVLGHLLRALDKPSELTACAFKAGQAPMNAGYSVKDIRGALGGRDAEPLPLVIGGGDILRTDASTVASHYLPARHITLSAPISAQGPARGQTRGLPYSMTIGPDDRARIFQHTYMPDDGAGPFLLAKADCPSISAIAYFSCGVPFRFRPAERPRIRDLLDQAVHIYVRDLSSAEKIAETGTSTPVRVAPDAAVAISDFLPTLKLQERGLDILRLHGIPPGEPVLGFQASRVLAKSQRTVVARQLTDFSARWGHRVVLVPVGYCHGDREVLKEICSYDPERLTYVEAGGILDIASLISTCQLFVGVSMHANITAFSYNVPFLLVDIGVDKIPGFLDCVDLREHGLKDWNRLSERLAWLREVSSIGFSSRVESAKERVYAVMGELTTALGLLPPTGGAHGEPCVNPQRERKVLKRDG
jgi:hypothetical protein